MEVDLNSKVIEDAIDETILTARRIKYKKFIASIKTIYLCKSGLFESDSEIKSNTFEEDRFAGISSYILSHKWDCEPPRFQFIFPGDETCTSRTETCKIQKIYKQRVPSGEFHVGSVSDPANYNIIDVIQTEPIDSELIIYVLRHLYDYADLETNTNDPKLNLENYKKGIQLGKIFAWTTPELISILKK